MHKLLGGALAAACLLGSQAALADVTVTGSYVKFGVNGNGSLIDFAGETGIQFDPTGSGNFDAGRDILLPSVPFAFYSLGVVGIYTVAGAGSAFNPFSDVTGSHAIDGKVATIASGGIFASLAIDQVISFDLASNVIRSSVVLTNTSGTTLTGIVYGVGLDADPDYRPDGELGTTNTILGQGTGAAVRAAGTDYAITLRNTSGWAATAGVRADWSIDPYALAGSAPDDADRDSTINLGYVLGTLDAGERVSFDYEYVLTSMASILPVAPVPEPQGWLAMLAGLGLLGAAARHRRS